MMGSGWQWLAEGLENGTFAYQLVPVREATQDGLCRSDRRIRGMKRVVRLYYAMGCHCLARRDGGGWQWESEGKVGRLLGENATDQEESGASRRTARWVRLSLPKTDNERIVSDPP